MGKRATTFLLIDPKKNTLEIDIDIPELRDVIHQSMQRHEPTRNKTLSMMYGVIREYLNRCEKEFEDDDA